MSRSTLAKVLLIALLFVTVLMTRPADRDWFTVAILIFGIVNVLLDPPATFGIRAMAIAATFAPMRASGSASSPAPQPTSSAVFPSSGIRP